MVEGHIVSTVYVSWRAWKGMVTRLYSTTFNTVKGEVMKKILTFLIIVLLTVPAILCGKARPIDIAEDSMATEVYHFTEVRSYREDSLTGIISNRFKDVPYVRIQAIVHEAMSLAMNHEVLTVEDILAVIWVESGFNIRAYNNGSVGLMQVEVKSHLDKIAGRDPYDIKTNMELGVDIFNEYFNELHSARSTWLAYNAGIANFHKGNFDTKYVDKIFAANRVLVTQL
jgi:hypothetical protein